MHPIRAVLVVSLALVGALALLACGGDSAADEDPQQVLDATFNNDQSISSGVFEVSIDLNTEGGDDAGSLEASLGGPFQGGDGGVPSFAITAEANVDSAQQQFSGSAGFVSTGDAAFLNFQDSDYEIPTDLYDRFEQGFLDAQKQQQQSEDGNLLGSLGVDPSNWLTDLSNEGTEDVEGTETVHISGQADVPDLVKDIKTIAERVPDAAEQVSPADLSQIDQLTGIIKSAELNIYSGVDDDILRKLGATLELDPPDAAGGAESISLEFAITLSDLNEPQTIEDPQGAQPLSTLLEQFGVDPNQLGQLQQ